MPGERQAERTAQHKDRAQQNEHRMTGGRHSADTSQMAIRGAQNMSASDYGPSSTTRSGIGVSSGGRRNSLGYTLQAAYRSGQSLLGSMPDETTSQSHASTDSLACSIVSAIPSVMTFC